MDAVDSRDLINEMTKALPAPVRALRVEVLAETMACGVPVDPAALTVVLAAHVDSVDEPLHFDPDHVSQLLWYEVLAFCTDHDIDLPAGCAAALHALLAALVRQERTGDADVVELFRPFDELGSLAVA